MNDDVPTEPVLHLVPDDVAEAATDADVVDAAPEGDPLLTRAQRIAELPLDERPAAFDGLNRALVAELQTLEEG